ncbi:MAG TPA: hypothetical protein DEB39_16085 [Planctomycetaceae bacterium]|nr:hypothetical protein [Planctomycetaceae bacterium]
MQAIDFNEVPAEGDRWGRFARDFLVELGLHTEPVIAAFPEGNGDFCAVEPIPGKFSFLSFRWLVSPRHKASTRTSVKESEEPELLERLLHARADGFLGFYSTPISPALLQTLAELKSGGHIRDYRVFDAKMLESHLLTTGFSRLLSRYFPNSTVQRRPIHLIEDAYLPLPCDHCGKDLLEALYKEDHQGVVARISIRPSSENTPQVVQEVYFACMGPCDESLQSEHIQGRVNTVSSVVPLADLVVPTLFMARILGLIDRLHSVGFEYADAALAKEKYLFRALSQRVLIEPTEGEIIRVKKMMFGPAGE